MSCLGKPHWDKDFYIVKRDHITLYLWYVKARTTKKDVANLGGFMSRSAAVSYLDRNWKILAEKEVENMLLGDGNVSGT